MFFRVLARQHREDQEVGNRLDVSGLLLDGLLECSLCFFGSAKVQLSHSLCDQAADRRRCLGLCQFFKDVECLLVLLSALTHFCQYAAKRKKKAFRVVATYQPHADPRLGQVDQKTVLCPSPRPNHFLQREIVAVLLEVNLDDQCNCLHCVTTQSVWAGRKKVG